MRLALLMTNTDRSDFAARHPRDGEKFRTLVGRVRPDWEVAVFDATEGAFPEDPGTFDGVMVGGSPASVHDDRPWIPTLLDVIRKATGDGVPLFGACFGHQAVALAHGGEVGPGPNGWALGNVTTEVTRPQGWMQPHAAAIRLPAAHKEQVLRLPGGAAAWGAAPGCAVAGFTLGDRVMTTQYHPEITPDFLAALMDEMEGDAPADALAEARRTLDPPADTALFAEWIARFFEGAGGRR